jgi:hypothetical protein
MKRKVAALLVASSFLLAAVVVPGVSQANAITPSNIHGCL